MHPGLDRLTAPHLDFLPGRMTLQALVLGENASPFRENEGTGNSPATHRHIPGKRCLTDLGEYGG